MDHCVLICCVALHSELVWKLLSLECVPYLRAFGSRCHTLGREVVVDEAAIIFVKCSVEVSHTLPSVTVLICRFPPDRWV